MQWLAEICVKRPIFATVLSLIIVVVGLGFYLQLGVDQFPKVDLPVVVITTRLPGASPEDVDTDVTDKVEDAVNTIAGIDELRSVSAEGVSTVIVSFILEKDPSVAAQEVRDAINRAVVDLPKGIELPVIQKLDPDAQPILYIALTAPGKDVRDVTELADRTVRRRLESVNGVGQVRLIGGRHRQINVWADALQMRGQGVSAAELARAIDAQNMNLPGGRVDESRDLLTLRVNGRVPNVPALARIIVKDSGGRSVRLEEVAQVEDGEDELETSAFWNGDPIVELALRKQSGTNTVEVVDTVLDRMKDVQKELPPGYELKVLRDNSQTIRTSTNAVKEHLLIGALLAALVVLLFLGNLRSTVIAAVAIPTSIIGTFTFMYAKGYTFNTITLLALALAVGIVIDDAIVVLENIFKHVEEHGQHPREAAVAGTKEIGLAVLATTLSLIAVFMPIAFLGGIPGRFLSSFGVTMAFSIAVSLFVSFSLTPMLASRWLKPHVKTDKKPLGQKVVDVFYRPIERVYVSVLGFFLRHRWVMVLLVIGSCGSLGVTGKLARKGFLPIDDKAQFEVLVRLPEGRSVAATEVVGERIAREIRQLDYVNATLVSVGDDDARTPNQARIYVKLVDPKERALTQNDMKDVVRKKILEHQPKDLRITVADVNDFGGGQSTARIQWILTGPDLTVLEKAAKNVEAGLKKFPGAVDVDTSMITGKPELSVYVDRDRAADLGVQVADVAQAIQLLVGGAKVSTYAENGEQYDIRLRADKKFRTDEDALRLLTVPSRKLGQVSLADVVTMKHNEGPATINRYARSRQVTFMANGAPGADESKISDEMQRLVKAEGLSPAYTMHGVGQTKLMQQMARSFGFGLLLAFIFMYLLLAAQFESWLHPITILMSLPLTIPFAALSVVLFDQALDIFAFLGIFVLFGVVKKNAILQIDHTNQLRERGMPREQAILQANKDRLRPILMTTLAFVAGMMPLVTARGIGANFSKAIAGVVVGGQSLSLALTLLAVPVLYSFFDDVQQFLYRLFFGRKEPAQMPVGGEVSK